MMRPGVDQVRCDLEQDHDAPDGRRGLLRHHPPKKVIVVVFVLLMGLGVEIAFVALRCVSLYRNAAQKSTEISDRCRGGDMA